MTGLFKRLFAAGALLGAALTFATPASAQATRTWVSGVGDDANPCSRTAPCKTFAGAISKTATGGEINCLDPGGWGAVTITKSITIDCLQFPGGILNAGQNGVTVNAGLGDTVTLRGLTINGGSSISPGLIGIRFLQGGALIVENTEIRGQLASGGTGIAFTPSNAGAKLFVTNTSIVNNNNGTTGSGIEITPSTGGSAKVVISNVNLVNNVNNGIRVNTANGAVQIAIDNAAISGGAQGVVMLASANPGNAVVTNSVIAGHTGTGILAAGSQAIIRVGNTTITGNATGVNGVSGASVQTYGTNRLNGNTVDGAFSLPPIPAQ